MTENRIRDAAAEARTMTPAEFRVVREFLGLTGAWLAVHMGVSPSTVDAWERGEEPIPGAARLALADLERLTGEFVAKAVDSLRDLPEPGIVTYRNDAEYRAAHRESGYPAAWHRAVVARVAQEVPGLSIAYASDVPSDEVKVSAG
ncbi:helix-turn-helix domain-containing protein [Streptomyces sp. NPDC059786]|uniref:helix-turn-helix domain-containing protein n=1 Tax=Streptomyces sp. NPDC059786 TaxID=3346946 RepID=UPI0036515924